MNIRKHLPYAGIFIFLIIAFSWVTSVKPPLSSPDEGTHLSRVYGLVNGYFILDPVGKYNVSGAYIDTSMRIAEAASNKFSLNENFDSFEKGMSDLRNIKWSGVDVPIELPSTMFYMPIVYAPQALSFLFAKAMDFNFLTSYSIANYVTFIFCIAILLLSYKIHTIPPLALFFIIMPMSIYQLMSPTTDGISIAFTVLCMSTFMRLSKNHEQRHYLLYLSLLVFSVISVASSKANLILLPLILLWLYVVNKKKSNIVAFLIATIITVGWTLYSITNLHDATMVRHPGYTNAEIMLYYLQNPLKFMSVFLNTITNPALARFYYESFIGRFGVLDAPIREYHRSVISVFLACTIIASIMLCKFKLFRKTHIFIAFIAISGAFLVFPALLAQWTNFPSELIQGIQGRYFIVPAIILGYSLPTSKKFNSIFIYCALIGLVYSSFVIHQSLQERYFGRSISLPVTKDVINTPTITPVPFEKPLEYTYDVPEGNVSDISVMFATYNNTAKGIVTLIACSKENCIKQDEDNKSMEDGNYYTFHLKKYLPIYNNELRLFISFKPHEESRPIVTYEYNSVSSEAKKYIQIKLKYN